MQNHFASLAEEVISDFKLGKNSLVVDIGSHDGTLLTAFSKHGPRVLGVEPASNIAKIAESKGIRTVNDFFGEKLADKILDRHGHADVILATNVLAHVDDLDDFLKGIKRLLSDDGVFIIEVPYLLNLLENREFDTIYHEHLSYFALHPLLRLFRKFGMEIVDVKQNAIHGGSIRVFAQKTGKKQSPDIARLLSMERREGLDSFETYVKFSGAVAALREKLVELLKMLKSRGARISGYGASAKGNVLLNYCRIGPDMLEYVIDTTPFQQGLFTPGMHIPVSAGSRLREDPTDYTLLLAWNYADDILKKEKEYRQKGGKFIFPVPEPKVV
jgi:SAM-dependent methyltransferase